MRSGHRRFHFLIFVLAMATLSACAQSGGTGDAARQKLDLPKPVPLVLTKDLGSGGTLVLDMNVGEVHVARNREAHRIELKIQPERFDDEAQVAGWVRRFEVSGEHAAIDLDLPKNGDHHHSAEVTISLPAETSLKLDLGIGEMIVDGIRGDKDLHVGIGQLTIAVENPAEYGPVEASVKIGDVEAGGFGLVESGGFFRTVKMETRRSYRLRAHVGIGDLALKQAGGS